MWIFQKNIFFYVHFILYEVVKMDLSLVYPRSFRLFVIISVFQEFILDACVNKL